jgi:hypothetical protein
MAIASCGACAVVIVVRLDCGALNSIIVRNIRHYSTQNKTKQKTQLFEGQSSEAWE